MQESLHSEELVAEIGEDHEKRKKRGGKLAKLLTAASPSNELWLYQ